MDSITFDHFQTEAAKLAIYPRETKVVYTALGLAGEAGEIANKVKKIIRDDGSNLTKKRKAAISKELGDVLWYAAMLAEDLGLSLGDIARNNIEFLNDRKERGVLQGDGDDR
jgi:NTP pyrophosphatase (non-canonical NTP hydrolase)